jgi:two-component system, chemotaxis family, chemotaxis protein CheY
MLENYITGHSEAARNEAMMKNIKILIVDDNEPMRTIIRRILEYGGYANSVEADDGSSAFKILKSQKIDLILSDWNMFGMTGIELLKKVREDESIAKTPFIMVSVEGGKVSVDTAIKCGASDFIAKPFTSKTIIETIEKVMGSNA